MLPLSSRQISKRLPLLFHPIQHPQACNQFVSPAHKHYSDASFKSSDAAKEAKQESDKPSTEEAKPKKKTQAELDAEVMAKLQGHDSEGGAAGIEYEDGKPSSMKRSVRNNMFRYI